MKEEFLSLFGLGNDLILPDKVEHSDKGAPVHPQTQHLNHDRPFLIPDNPLGEEHPKTPEANDDNGLEGQCDQVKPGEEELGIKVTLVLM